MIHKSLLSAACFIAAIIIFSSNIVLARTQIGTVFPPNGCSPLAPLITWTGDGDTRCIALPVCGAGQALTTTAPSTFDCVALSGGNDTTPTEPTPNCKNDGVSYPTGKGSCSETCGGGLRSLYWRTNCGDTWETQENCNTQACNNGTTCQQRIVSSGACSTTCGGGIQTLQWDNGCGATWTGVGRCNEQPCTGGGQHCTITGLPTGTGSCSATCGGGTQDVYYTDSCGKTVTQTQTCNITPCRN